MKNVLNLINDYVIVIDKGGDIQFCNEQILSRLLYNEDELINLNISQILKNGYTDLIDIIKDIKIDEKKQIKLTLISSENKFVELSSEITLDMFNDKEDIYIILKDICEKNYNIEDLEELLDSLPSDIWIKDLEGKYKYTNQQYADRMKCNKNDMIGKDNSFFWGTENKGNRFLDMEDEIIETKMPKFSEEFVIHDNKEKYFEMYKAPIIDKNGEVKYTIGLCRDITLKKTVENGIYENNKKISTLESILNSNKEDKNLDEVLDNIALNIVESLEADGLAIFLYEEKNNCLKLSNTQGISTRALDENYRIYLDAIDKEALVNKDIKILHNTDIERRRLEFCKKINQQIEHSESYKLIIDREFIGIITATYLEGNYPKYNQDEFINIVCKQIAMIIKNYRLSNEIKDEFEKRSQIEKELEVFLDISVDAIAILTNKGEILSVSPSITKIIGWSDKDLLNRIAIDIVHPDDKSEVIDTFIKKSRDTVRKQSRVLCKNGEYKWLDWNYRYIEEKNCFVITARDITQEKKEEEQRKALEESIHLESLKNEFFANISHEFKTPINIILGTMQLLDKNIINENIIVNNEINLNRHVKSIKQNSYRLLRLVNNLIDMTRIDTGYYELQLGNYNIVNIVESIALSVAQYIENKGINLIFDTNEEEVLLACDPDKIERIVLNILSNAIKYTDRDGEIFVGIDVKDDKVITSIKDTGLGISKEKLPLIFERFRQGDHLLTRNCDGSGIGLSLVKSLVEMHEGNIYAISEQGKGSKFVFELPIRLVENKCDIKEDVYEDFRIEKCNIEFSDIYSDIY